ncbi:isoleucine--tRNA ligase [Microbacter margulisiae]|uniref:Isoleucine--tRNA ligase n=1 Tax=Microbacter margulisiae TaxID=1350067 RepID=A0A7W5DTA6_9PORP|nr:isoleucine--tRNA ligase [Microbacter margulisiae]MBB3188506.1 isoleucyl-tRNA synthetase [Microbacter margulisiae]
MSKKFTEHNAFDLAGMNKEILEQWDKQDVFRQSLETRKGNPSFVFYEGPPSANGMPGIHHVMARTIKDIFCRYKTMKGYYVERKAGWDTHGLPVELGVEKRLGITKEDIGKTISVEEYNAACRKDVMQYTREWEDLTRKMGYWVDMQHPYITYDNHYIETLWFLLKRLYEKGYLYKGYTIQPYSPAAGTGLSTHELNQPGCYRDVKDTTCVAQFRINDPKPEWKQWGDAYFLAWTTTPWTLPSNTALCVGPSITYVAVQSYNPYTGTPATYILAKELLSQHFNPKAADIPLDAYKTGDKLIPFKVVGEYVGKQLEGVTYEQLIPFVKIEKNAFRVITGDFVTTEDGTGIVHIAPTFGADDDRVAKANGVPPMLLTDKDGNQRPMVDLTGKFYKVEDLDADFVVKSVNIPVYKEYAGRYVKNSYDDTLTEDDAPLDVDLSVMLKQQGLAFKIEKHVHSYPHCWRTDKPVLYYPLDSWFIRTTACRERMMELNETINWKPQSTGTGRFGKWLENLQDWNLSRSRYWGTPLPIWRTEDGAEEKCIGSLNELYAEIEQAVAAGVMKSNPFKDKGFVPEDFSKPNYDKIDLHRPYVDDIILVSGSGKPMKRESDLIDVWFDSGSMPYAQVHYPFENRELIDGKTAFPADFIAEGVDQTRGWFFTLHAIAAMAFDSVSFKAVVSNGLVLDKNGNKMSKRLGNAVDPFSTIEKYGSDPLRWYMITNASPWDNLKFDVDGIEEVRRKFFGTLYNTYSFFALYANVDGFAYREDEIPLNERPEIDRWILSLLNTLIDETNTYYNTYEPTRAGRAIAEFVNDHLSNWYVRLNRKRFWGGGYNQDKISAYQTLYTCLETVARLMAPISPFYADRLYLDLISVTGKGDTVSVHLASFPEANMQYIDKTLEERMNLAQSISSMVLSLRKKVNIKVRQPLSSILLPVKDAVVREHIESVQPLILSETNVKELRFVENTAGILVKRVKPDFKKLGPKFGKIMKQLSSTIAAMTQEEIMLLEQDGVWSCMIDNQQVSVEASDVEIISEDIPGWLVANEGNLTVALDITLTESLLQEGIARELVNRIQNLRKTNGYEITDRIVIRFLRSEYIEEAVKTYADYISGQTLANSITFVSQLTENIEVDFESFKVYLYIGKA